MPLILQSTLHCARNWHPWQLTPSHKWINSTTSIPKWFGKYFPIWSCHISEFVDNLFPQHHLTIEKAIKSDILPTYCSKTRKKHSLGLSKCAHSSSHHVPGVWLHEGGRSSSNILEHINFKSELRSTMQDQRLWFDVNVNWERHFKGDIDFTDIFDKLSLINNIYIIRIII